VLALAANPTGPANENQVADLSLTIASGAFTPTGN
jgi:hypothetical protein